MAKPTKTMNVKLDEVVFKMSDNIREPFASEFLDEKMIESLGLIGQETTAKLLKRPDGTYMPIQGFRRVTNLQEAAKRGIIDPKTGKVFSTVYAEVYEDLPRHEVLAMMIDQGTMRTLTKGAVFLAAEQAFLSDEYTEKEVAVLLGHLLEQHYAPTRKLLKAGEIDPKTSMPVSPDQAATILLEYYRGVIQSFKQAALSPTVLRDQFYAKCSKGEQSWPTNKELSELYKVHEAEVKADKTGKFCRDHPGPIFMKRWEKYLSDIEAALAERDGKAKRHKTTAMLSRDQIDQLRSKSFQSRTAKIICMIVLNEITKGAAPMVDSVLVALEKQMTAEQTAMLDKITGVEEAVKEPASEEPVTNEPATNEPVTNEPVTNEPAVSELQVA